MTLPKIDDADRRRINPNIMLIPSNLGVGLDNFLEFPCPLEERLIPSFIRHLVDSNNHIAEMGFDRTERESYTTQRELFPAIALPNKRYERRAGYIKDEEGKEYVFHLVRENLGEGQLGAFTGIRMHDDVWLLAIYDNIRSYKPE